MATQNDASDEAAAEPEALQGPEDSTWAKSEAKRVLKEDILEGRVTNGMEAKAVHESRPLFMMWGFTRFSANLKNLRASLARDCSRMLKDCECCGNDASALVQLRKKYPLKEVPFHLSAAKALLADDVTNSRHEGLKPAEFHGVRPEYLAFEPGQFRKFLHQEIKRQEKSASNIRCHKQKVCSAKTHPDPVDVMEMIDEHDKKPPAKAKKQKVDPVKAAKKKLKQEDIDNLPENQRAKVSRKR